MRLMYTTALASAVMFAAPALAAGDKVESTTGMTQPESSAAQLHGHSADSGVISQNFAGAGFQNWQEARDVQILRMQSGDGQPVWVFLMPDGFQVGAADSQGMESGSSDLAAAPGSSIDQQELPDVSEQADAGEMPQRGEEADISETFEGGEQADVAEGSDLGQAGDQTDMAAGSDLPDVGAEVGGQADIAEAPDVGQDTGQQDLAEVPERHGEAGGQADIAEAPELGEQGIVGQTEPQGFAAQIPGELQSDLEGAGFQQIESVDGANVFHAETQDGQTAFIIVGDLSGAGLGFGGQQPIDLDRAAPGGAPGATPDLPQPAPGTAPGQQQ